MSDLVNLYNTSEAPRVKAAREIPERELNFFDRENAVQEEFNNFPELKKTTFTNEALNSFDSRRQNFSIPESFTPIQQGINLNRWNEKNKYYNPGQPQE